MNTSQGALYFGAGIDLNQWRRDVDSMRRDIVGLTRDVEKETRNVDSAFKNLSIGIAGYFSVGALKNFAMELINVRGEFQKIEIAFSTMLGSADKAKVLMGQMVDLAAKTPFGLQEVSAGAKQLLAFQIPANQVVDVLTRMGNIAAGLGVPLSRINLVYGQVKAKGKLMGDDLRQFTEAGIPMVAELAKKFNKTTAEIQEMVSAGKIGFKDVQDVLFAMTNEGGMFFNLMEKQSASLSGKVANLGDTWDQMLNKIGEGSEGILYSGIEGLTYLVEHYQDLLNIVEALIITYGSYKAAVIVASAAQTFANKTIQSEIALLSISEKMKLGRAMVTQRQAEATAREAAAEVTNLEAKYAAMRVETSLLVSKKAMLRQTAVNTAAALQEAKLKLSLAQLELGSIQATGTAREIELAQKRVAMSQNTVLATQETAKIARNTALANSTAIFNNREALKLSTQRISIAQNAAATASEAAQIAAKNANAIATTRLTIATRFRTAATQLATQAQVLLNATMLNNSIVIVIAAIAGLTYAYFRLRDTTTSLSIAEKQLNEERKKSSEYIENLKNKTQELTSVINSDTATKLQQVEAYNILSKMMPDLLKDMDLETFKKLGNTEAQKKLNTEIDKYSTQNIRNQVAAAQGKIQEFTLKINQLNEALKKRDGDSGVQLTQLEYAKKNLEAQKIVLNDYNTKLKERLFNEKISSMNLLEQKKYWEDQINSISDQVSALEKSNTKKAQGIDKLNTMNSIVKSTSIGLLNWNITPLLTQLDRAKSELNKINNSQSETGVNKNKAYWEQQKKAAEEANDAMSGKDMGSAGWQANIKKIREATEELKKYDYTDKEALKAQKARDKERKALEKGAEKSYITGSIKRYDQQISLLEEALSRSDGKDVRLRYVDKYGKERNAEEVRSLKSVQDELIKLREDRAAREKLIEVKTFQEKLEEGERQWNNYYKMAEFYGKESADAQYKELFKGSQSYLEYLEKIQTSLNLKKDSGQLFTETDKNNLVDITDKINQLTGVKTPLENFKKDIENSLKELPALTDQIILLDQELAKAQLQEGNVNTSELLGKTNLIKEKKEEILNLQKDLYREFIIEQTTFEDKKSAIEKKYNLIRQQIGLNQSLTETERLRQLDEAGKDEAKEYGNAFLDTFKKTKIWEKIFGNMNTISKREVEKLIPILKAQIAKLISLNAPIEEIERYKQKLEELETFTSGNSPVEKLVASFKKLTKQAKNADGKIDWRNFAKNYESFSEALSASVDTAFELGDALGFMGNTDGMKETINNLMETTKGLVNAVAGYATDDYAQMAGGIVQMTMGLSKMLNGDDDKSFSIRGWERDINSLKTAYEQLNREITKTAGSEQFDKQKELVANLEKQKEALQNILKLEKEKKKPDAGKVNEYENQIAQINGQIEDLVDGITASIAGANFKDLATQLSDALTEAFGKGEDAALAYEKVVDDVMRNAVKNALKIAILEPATKSIVDSLIKSMGYGSGGNSEVKNQIADAEKLLNSYEKERYDLMTSGNSYSYRAIELAQLVKDLKAKIDLLKTQQNTSQLGGAFDGLTKEERDKIKAQGIDAMNQYTAALQQYEDLFGGAAENAQALKGDIKGITEKTAGALEAQFNAFRINLVALLQVAKQNNIVQNAHTVLLSQIEVNTRHLYTIRKDIAELNQKVKKGAAGIP
jgi:tape measure domain-containing protein